MNHRLPNKEVNMSTCLAQIIYLREGIRLALQDVAI